MATVAGIQSSSAVTKANAPAPHGGVAAAEPGGSAPTVGPAALAAISAKGQRTAGKAGVTSGGSTSSAAQQAQLRALVQRAMADVAKMASNPAGAAATVQQINSMLQQAQQAGGGNAQGAAIVQQLGRLLQRARAEEASGVSSGA